MSRDKQIEEMAKSICENYGACSKCSLKNIDKDDTCSVYQECEVLYNAGYRKDSDVAREIFSELTEIGMVTKVVRDGEIVYDIKDKFDRLKNKHLGKDINVPTKESETIE